MSYPVMSTDVPWSLVKSGFHKTPHFNSSVQKPATGRGRSGVSYMPFATWDFALDLNLVCGGEAVQYSVLQKFLGCFMACCGSAGFFLFTDPNDNSVDDTGLTTPQSLLIAAPNGALQQGQTKGDGVTFQFQLARQIDQGVDILQQVSNVLILVNGVPDGATIVNGVATFSTPPPLNATLSWSGSFQYLCQFTDDSLKDLARLSKNSGGFLWSATVDFESVFA
jgi:hypothetical protein